jgi:hypothetical protein
MIVMISKQVVYPGAAAEALALSGFPFGLGVLVLIGTLKRGHYQRLDEVWSQVNGRLGAFGAHCSRPNMMDLFKVYSALLRTFHQRRDDPGVAR